MARLVDLFCECGRREVDVLCSPEEIIECPDCHKGMQQDWLPRVRRDAQWDDRTAVMVHVNAATGQVSYPGRHDAKLRPGYERVYLRSLDAVNRFERDHKVAVHAMHYDNNGRAIDDHVPGVD